MQTAACAGMQSGYSTGAPWINKSGVADSDKRMQAALTLLNEGRLETLSGQIKATLYGDKPTCDVKIYVRRAVV